MGERTAPWGRARVKRRLTRGLVVGLAGVGAALGLSLACAPVPPAAVLTRHLPEGGPTFAAVGDLQRTSTLEFWRESNDGERERLVREITRVRPGFLVSLGDLVFDGASERHWARLDALTAPLREADIPVLPVLGNHEYWGSDAAALANYFQRFPVLEGRRWYCRMQGPVGLVFVDTNLDVLDDARRREQLAWLDATLSAFEADRSVRGVLLFGHHPPFTNSTVTGDEQDVQEQLVPRVLRFPKVLGYFSGHVHNYERYVRGGKLFVVSGGGGGPRARLATGSQRRHPDDLFQGPPVRDFHFLLFHPGPEGLEVEARGLAKGGEAFTPMDRFTLPWPEPSGDGTTSAECLGSR